MIYTCIVMYESVMYDISRYRIMMYTRPEMMINTYIV